LMSHHFIETGSTLYTVDALKKARLLGRPYVHLLSLVFAWMLSPSMH
jgi:hypothetical protein